jgi:hypothetical protein
VGTGIALIAVAQPARWPSGIAFATYQNKN